MTNDLRNIRRFDDLVEYLENELGWPLDGYGVEDLTYDFEPEELGLKRSEAAKIKSIRQLRPLQDGQPWGIFFIEFDHKRLPIVVLRRILSHLVIKKRASANQAERPAWNAQDLLFISAFGPEEDNKREIGFAHFQQPAEDLPTLRVLGWDGDDTSLKLNRIHDTLKNSLHWPESGESVVAWRERWAGAFKHKMGHVIRTADALAKELAHLARRIQSSMRILIEHESERGPLHKLHKAFQTHLIHDLSEEGFADTYAQTLTYGLLTAAFALSNASGGSTKEKLLASHLPKLVPSTNPFLRELLETFLKVGGRDGAIDFDELGIQDVVELLRSANTDLKAVIEDFGNKTRGEDPVMHFFEGFLEAYNKAIRKNRGVFYTPQPVVSYIVRSVHELLQTEFGLADGLADTTTWGEMLQKNPDLKLPPLTDEPGETRTISPDEAFVQILDPATGTATFLVEVIEVIHRTLMEKWKRLTAAQREAAWNEYVPKQLLPRLHAFELMMAPYAIAHMKIGLKLAETGYHFGAEERARIYLTNALEPKVKQLPQIGFDALAHEAAAVNEIKWYKRFTVVIGNPPYSGHSANDGQWISDLVDKYYFVDGQPLGERTAKWLQDDYVKFIRFGEHHLSQTGGGVLGYITNHGYLDNPTFRGMRFSLLRQPASLHILDLHGNLKKKERTPTGGIDENVFDIQPGVAICLLTFKGRNTGLRLHSHLFGLRSEKYHVLTTTSVSTSKQTPFQPSAPFFILYPQDIDLRDEFAGFWKSTEIFPRNGVGMTTARDHVVIDFDRQPLVLRATLFRDSTASDSDLCRLLEIPEKKGWSVSAARKLIRSERNLESHICGVAYRPFDNRLIFYHDSLVWRTVRSVMQNMAAGNNLGLAVGRAGQVINQGEWNLVYATRRMTEFNLYRRGGNNLAPLYVCSDSHGLGLSNHPVPNLAPAFLRQLAARLSIPQKRPHNLPQGLTPEDIFHYIYAVFHSPGYRSRYAEFLKIDFPRLPLTGRLNLFRQLARLGSDLTALHLLESPKLNQPMSTFIGDSREVVKVGYVDNTVWLDAGGKRAETRPGTSGFQGVPEAVWKFHIGGYQVCEKWLKDRKGRTLSEEDIEHYHKIVVALSETILLMAEIDTVIEAHGGWPGAFQSGTNEADSEPVLKVAESD
jgi:hypothetical protein